MLREKYVYIYLSILHAEATLQGCYHENAPWKIPPNTQENTHAKVQPQQSRHVAFLKSHSNLGAPPETNPRKHPPQEHPQGTPPAYTQKSKLI